MILKYFSWGDIIGQNKNGRGSYFFSQANYNAGLCGSDHTLTGNIPQGDTTYDAATANMGATWKMPTYNHADELINGTNSTWITLNGKNGRKFTSKTDASKYIFLPAAGWWNAASHNNPTQFGSYWTTMYSSTTKAGAMYSGSDNLYISVISSRWPGCSVCAIS